MLANEQTRAWTDRAAIHPGRGIACEGGEALVALSSDAAVGGRLRRTVRVIYVVRRSVVLHFGQVTSMNFPRGTRSF